MIYWINIDKCELRKKHMIQQYKQKKLQHQRISATIPATLPKIIPSPKYPNIKKEEYSCLSSHLIAMEAGINNSSDNFIIMEDDTTIPFNIDYDKLIETAPKDWEILQLYISELSVLKSLYKKFLAGNMWSKWAPGYFCTGVYIIKKEAAKKIINILKKNNTKGKEINLSQFKSTPVADNILYRLVKTYSCNYPLFYSNINLNSEIHKEHLIRHEKANDYIKLIQKEQNKKPENIFIKFK